MTQKEKENLIKKILQRNELYLLQGSRLRRVLKDPFRTLWFYLLQSIAYVHPYKIEKKTLWGVPMSYYLPEASMIYYYGFFEANLSIFLINFLQEGDSFFDVGAHVGYYSMLASELVGKSGHIYSFEPTPRTFETLKENAGKKKNIVALNRAVLHEEKTIDFFDYGPKYSAFNTFQKRTSKEIFFKDVVQKVSVKTISLDKYVTKNSLRPDFIKIDAEGAESLILESMATILKDNKPVVTIEVSTVKEWEGNLARSFKIFKKYQYDCFEITVAGKLIPCDPTEPRAYDNLLFAHPDKMSRLQKLIIPQ